MTTALLRRVLSGATALAITATAAVALGTTTTIARADVPPAGEGGERYPVTELVGQFPLPKLDATEAHLSISRWGYRYQAGLADNDLRITEVDGRLKYVDRAARSWAKLPKTCRRVSVERGIGAICRIPAKFQQGRMFLEIWPRLGDDTINGAGLPRRYRMWVLTDEGADRVVMGRGDDFANTAFSRDVVYGGPGDDWIRVGDSNNVAFGGPGDDKLVGGVGDDRLHGGPGGDQVGGLEGSDILWGDAGADVIRGGAGRDIAYREGPDKIRDVEVIRR